MFSFRRRKTLIIVVTSLLLVALLLLSMVPGSPIATTSGPLSFITTPIQRQLMILKQKIGSTFTILKDGTALRQENDKLKEENARLRQLQTQNEAAIKEANEFRQAFALRDKYADVQLLGTRVISNGMGLPSDTIRIDIGSNQGIVLAETEAFPVVNEWGVLVGRVFSSDATSSKVITMTSNYFSLSCSIGDSKTIARLGGDVLLKNSNTAMIDQIPEGAALKVGDQVVTSGEGGTYPSGLSIGKISRIDFSASGKVERAFVTVIEANKVGSILFVMKSKKP